LNYGRFLSHCPGLPGADSLIRHLYQAKIPLAICTNSSEPHFNVKMKSYQHWLQMIPTIVTSSDSEVKRPKPFPDPYLVTMKKFAVKPKSPKNVLVFEGSFIFL
jgi:beta-phosphoglucomutase-like phosphatase (HAD superfamily)